MKKTKKQNNEPLYEVSGTNRQMINYEVYKMTSNEKLLYVFLAFAVEGQIADIYLPATYTAM